MSRERLPDRRQVSERPAVRVALARARPPFRPSSTAALFLPSSVNSSSISPVAILATMTAAPTASAGRFSPFGPLGMVNPSPRQLITDRKGSTAPLRRAG